MHVVRDLGGGHRLGLRTRATGIPLSTASPPVPPKLANVRWLSEGCR